MFQYCVKTYMWNNLKQSIVNVWFPINHLVFYCTIPNTYAVEVWSDHIEFLKINKFKNARQFFCQNIFSVQKRHILFYLSQNDSGRRNYRGTTYYAEFLYNVCVLFFFLEKIAASDDRDLLQYMSWVIRHNFCLYHRIKFKVIADLILFTIRPSSRSVQYILSLHWSFPGMNVCGCSWSTIPRNGKRQRSDEKNEIFQFFYKFWQYSFNPFLGPILRERHFHIIAHRTGSTLRNWFLEKNQLYNSSWSWTGSSLQAVNSRAMSRVEEKMRAWELSWVSFTIFWSVYTNVN